MNHTLQTAAGDAVTLHFSIIIQTTKKQHSQTTQSILHTSITPQHSILTYSDCRPSTRPRKEAMLGNVTDHQAAETNK